MSEELPAALAEIREDFLAVSDNDRVQLLLEFSDELPGLPEKYENHPDIGEQVLECQSPVFIFVDIDEAGLVQMHATAPPEAPTTRGFASIIQQGVNGLTPEEVLAVPADFPQSLGLAKLISPLRLRGMTALLARVQRKVREKLA